MVVDRGVSGGRGAHVVGRMVREKGEPSKMTERPKEVLRWLRIIALCAILSVGLQSLGLYLAWQIARLARVL